MSEYGDAFIGLDTSKAKNAVAIAEDGRGGEVRYLGELENTGHCRKFGGAVVGRV